MENNDWPHFAYLVKPLGHMPDIAAAHAIWYFLIFAHKQMDRIERDVNYETDGMTEQSRMKERERDTKCHSEFLRVAHMTSKLYGVTMDEMLSNRMLLQAEMHCQRIGVVIDSKIKNWIRSGGKASYEPEQGSYWHSKEK